MGSWRVRRIERRGHQPTGLTDGRVTGRSVHSYHPSIAGVLLILLLGTGGCFFGKKPETSDSGWSTDVPIHVVNNHWLDIAVYVIHDGQRTRLGVAGGTAETQLVLPHRLLGMGGHVQLYGDPIGSSEQTITEVLNVQPGQMIEWLLEWGLERSSVGVY